MPDIVNKQAKRTEEIQDIVNRIPTTFGHYITGLVVLIFFLLIFFGYIIRYPDVVIGKLTVNTEQPPIKLIIEGTGKLRLNHIRSQQRVKREQILAWVENTTTPRDIDWLYSTIKDVKPPFDNAYSLYQKLPQNRELGDLTSFYSSFLLALKDLGDHQKNHLIDKQILAVNQMLSEQNIALSLLEKQKSNSIKALALANRFYSRDSVLFSKKVISASEYDQSTLSRITSNTQHQEILKELSGTYEKTGNTKRSLQELSIKKEQTERALILQVLTSRNAIIEQLKEWEHKFLIRAPFDGRVQFLNFWSENQFVRAGEPLFTVVPELNRIVGQVTLPSVGAGKVKVGQEVIVKLDDYPYMEYGYIRGKVSSISLTTNTQNTPLGEIENYFVNVELPSKLKTNFGSELVYKNEIKGIAEIITKDRRLIERFFDNIKYSINK